MFEHKNALFHRSQTMVLRPYYTDHPLCYTDLNRHQ